MADDRIRWILVFKSTSILLTYIKEYQANEIKFENTLIILLTLKLVTLNSLKAHKLI